MTITTSQRDDAYRFFAIAFAAAPGAEYYGQLVAAYESGMSTKSVVNVFTTKSQFTNVYAANLSTQDFASLIIENVVGTSATEAAKTAAKKDVVGAIDFGFSRGDIVYQLFSNLASKPSTDADWAGTAKLMQNQVQVAKYVSEYRPLATTDLTVLQNAIKSVTSTTDVSTVTAIKAVLTTANVNLGGLTLQTTSADNYTGTAGNDAVDGGVGNDTLSGGAGDDILVGGSGADSLYGEQGQDYIEGGDGADRIDVGYYYKSVWVDGGYDAFGKYVYGYYKYSADVWFEVADGGDGADTISGGLGSDLLLGGEGADTIYGDGESYYVYGVNNGLSVDTVEKMYKDTIYGGGGDDTIYGEAGNDVVYAESGDDYVHASKGNNYVEGGDGNDRLEGGRYYSNDNSSDTIYGGAGNDTISLNNPADDIAALLDGGSGNDTISLSIGKTKASASIKAGDGIDTINIDMYVDSAVSVDLTESVQFKDTLSVGWSSDANALPLNPAVVHGFSLASDALNIGFFNLYGSADWSYSSQDLSYSSGAVAINRVQTVTSPSTPWLTPQGTSIDRSGKGIFVIKGAQAAAADTVTVAAFLDAYGNNATYAKSAAHFFVLDVANVGMGVYYFKDDTGANAKVVADELVPVVVLVGASTASLDASLPGFFMV
jgi:Ca2+-binding RTX toxin-like protein